VCEWTHCFTSEAGSYYVTRLRSDLGVSCQFQLPVSSTMASATLILNIIFRNVKKFHPKKIIIKEKKENKVVLFNNNLEYFIFW
jgi:hypothetical protein